MTDRWQTLPIPTNPNYDWSEGQNQANFFNPVTLCNKEIQYANDIITITGQLIEYNREIGAKKFRLRQLEDQREDMETAALADQPPSQAESKNLKLLSAYILNAILTSSNAEEYQRVCAEQAEIEQDLIPLEIKKSSAESALDALKLVSQNIQTALSYYKAEMKTFAR